MLTVLLVKRHIYLIEFGITKPSSLQQKDSNFAVGEMLVARVQSSNFSGLPTIDDRLMPAWTLYVRK